MLFFPEYENEVRVNNILYVVFDFARAAIVVIDRNPIKLGGRRLAFHKAWTTGLFGFLIMASGVQCWGTTFIWNGGGTNANWSTASNWIGGIAPANNGTAAGSTR